MTEFTIGQHVFRTEQLDPKKAFHVGRRLAPVIGSLKELAPLISTDSLNMEDLGTIAAVLEPIAEVLARIPEADADYILNTCLEATSLKIDGDRGWAPVQVRGNIMFDWITMPQMLQIVWRVIQQSVASFLSAGSQAG